MNMALVTEAVQFLLSEIHTIDPGKVAKAANLISDLELAKKSVGFAAPAWDWMHKLGKHEFVKHDDDSTASGGVVPLTVGTSGVAPLVSGDRTGIMRDFREKTGVATAGFVDMSKVAFVPATTGVVNTPADVTSTVVQIVPPVESAQTVVTGMTAVGIADPAAVSTVETK